MDAYIDLNQLPILKDKGKKSSKDAKDKAMYEFNKFRKIQDREYMSDFDKMIDEVKRLSS